jgi:twitching motility protein PilT
MDVNDLLQLMVDRGASDLHLKAGSPPCVRVNGELEIADYPALTREDARAVAATLVPGRLRGDFEARAEVDFAFTTKNLGRFRVNAFLQQGQIGMAIRRIAAEELDIQKLGLPAVLKSLAEEARGLVLVTGTAGSGKTTTLAAMIHHINHTRRGHIVTIEDPIEVIHTDKKCLVNQREIGIDTRSYVEALKHVVRQDPDVIFIGEMRDLETVEAALSAAEMGNLVLSTLHTIDAAETINRIIDFFPTHQQQQIRLMLASTLRGIVSLRLLPRTTGGLVPAIEIMIATATVRELINENKTWKLKDVIEQGEYYGMQSFDQSLISLYQAGEIALEDAVAMSANAHDFKLKIRQLGVETPMQEV